MYMFNVHAPTVCSRIVAYKGKTQAGEKMMNTLQVGINYQPPTVIPGGDLAKVF